MLLNKFFYIVISAIFIIFSIIIFGWGRLIKLANEDYLLDNTLFGTFGDFIGGVLGTIFTIISVLLVIKTFKYQQMVTSSNETQLIVQRFNDLFFELLHLYQNQVNELCGQLDNFDKKSDSETTELQYNNKDFFDIEKVILQNNFKHKKSFEDNRNASVIDYMKFYIENRTKIAAYFRTLYRIYDLIDNAKIEETSKKNYLKIIRAQLTESELFFLRYNAMTYYGRKFIKYINKYHVLKHLPAFELLEFKDWWKDLDNIERAGLNIIFDNLNNVLRKTLSNKDHIFKSKNQGKYNFEVKVEGGYDIEIKIIIDRNKNNQSMELLALEKFNNKRIQQLLDCFIKEIFFYSNFNTLNKENVITYSNPIVNKNNITIINSGIKNTLKDPLKLNSYKVDY